MSLLGAEELSVLSGRQTDTWLDTQMWWVRTYSCGLRGPSYQGSHVGCHSCENTQEKMLSAPNHSKTWTQRRAHTSHCIRHIPNTACVTNIYLKSILCSCLLHPVTLTLSSPQKHLVTPRTLHLISVTICVALRVTYLAGCQQKGAGLPCLVPQAHATVPGTQVSTCILGATVTTVTDSSVRMSQA